eukprot:jgi/Botrbrau1/22609/Bobra.176_1s0039.1
MGDLSSTSVECTKELALLDREGSAHYRAPRVQLSLADFTLIRRIGEGSFAQVIQVRHKQLGKEYALKIVDKHLVVRYKQVDNIRRERALLDILDNPGVIKLYFTFQDAASLYLGLQLCENGELYDQIERKGRLPLDQAQLYAAEIVLTLEYLRHMQVIHRDLKPENLLLDDDGHLKLIDFGCAKWFADPLKSQAPPKLVPRRRRPPATLAEEVADPSLDDSGTSGSPTHSVGGRPEAEGGQASNQIATHDAVVPGQTSNPRFPQGDATGQASDNPSDVAADCPEVPEGTPGGQWAGGEARMGNPEGASVDEAEQHRGGSNMPALSKPVEDLNVQLHAGFEPTTAQACTELGEGAEGKNNGGGEKRKAGGEGDESTGGEEDKNREDGEEKEGEGPGHRSGEGGEAYKCEDGGSETSGGEGGEAETEGAWKILKKKAQRGEGGRYSSLGTDARASWRGARLVFCWHCRIRRARGTDELPGVLLGGPVGFRLRPVPDAGGEASLQGGQRVPHAPGRHRRALQHPGRHAGGCGRPHRGAASPRPR